MGKVTLLQGNHGLPTDLEIPDRSGARGGEAEVFFTTDGKYAVKLYHRVAADKTKLLQQVLTLGQNLGEDGQFLAWPLGIVGTHNGKPRVGVVTRRASGAKLVNYMISPTAARDQFQQGRSWLDYVKMARAVAAAAKVVHDKGITHGDISHNNYLVDIAMNAVAMIDLDGVIVPGFLAPQVGGTPGFRAPELVMGTAKPNQQTDRHSGAVLVLWTLLFRNVMNPLVCYDDEDEQRDEMLGWGQEACFSEHPTDRRNFDRTIGMPYWRHGQLSYRVLSPKLQELTDRALIHGLKDPMKRPAMREWEAALAESYDLFYACPKCRQSYTYQYWVQPPPRRGCPFCGERAASPLPAVLELLESKARGVHVPVRTVVLYHGLPLFADQTDPGRAPPPTRRGVPIVGQTMWDPRLNAYRLGNSSDTPWSIVTGGGGQTRINRGESAPLRPGMVLSFGEGKRLARVLE